jgi:hypothetical protein
MGAMRIRITGLRASIGVLVVLCLAASRANAADVVLSCVVEETGANHARRTLEIEFDQQNQIVTIGKTVSTAAITEAKITFRVDLGAGVPFSFAIDRTTGLIRVTGSAGALYNGKCTITDSSHPA